MSLMPPLAGRRRFYPLPARAIAALTAMGSVAAFGVAAPAAHAQLLFALSPPDLTAAPGGTVTFTGTLTNRYTQRLYLNGLTGQFTTSSAGTVDANSFLNYVPAFLDSNMSYTGSIFNATLSTGATVGTTYDGIVNIQGGSDPGAQQMLAFQNFTVTATSSVTPAPPAGAVFAVLGGVGFGFHTVRRRYQATSKSSASARG